ncbi:carboxymuconolactone decarboxylase family protein [Streptomyces sp. SBR177]
MPRLPQLTVESANEEQRELLESTLKQLGKLPNLYAALANGPAALRGYLAMRDALVGGSFSARQREQLALYIAQRNDCTYCVSAHTLRGGKVGLSEQELLATRRARTPVTRTWTRSCGSPAPSWRAAAGSATRPSPTPAPPASPTPNSPRSSATWRSTCCRTSSITLRNRNWTFRWFRRSSPSRVLRCRQGCRERGSVRHPCGVKRPTGAIERAA